MAQHRQALKRHRQSIKRRLSNRHFRTAMSTGIKKFLTKVDELKFDDAKELLKQAISVISHTASKGAVPKPRASRKISRLNKFLNSKMAAAQQQVTQ